MSEGMKLGGVVFVHRCIAAMLVAISPVSVDLFAQPIDLRLEGNDSRTVPLRTIRQSDLLLVSVDDIANALSLRSKQNTRSYSLAVQRGSITTNFIADNTFVIIEESGKEKRARQLCSGVIYSVSTFYVPVPSLMQDFEQFFGVGATYDPSANVIRIAKPKSPFDISTLTFEKKANGTLVFIPSEKVFADGDAILKQDGWLYITIPGAKGDVAALRKVRLSPPVKKLVVQQFSTSLQLTLRVDEKIKAAELLRDNRSPGFVVLLRDESQLPVSVQEKSVTQKRPVVADEHRKKYDLDVIVLDAGHGGKDPGTIGVRGTYEKTVALGVVLKLGKLIEENLKDVKVEYTRKTDTFVELDKRGQFANEKNGKLFISIHCNAMPKRPHPRRGFEVYLLRPGRTDEAIQIAELENSVIELEEGYEERYKKLTDENFILVTMAQTAHMRASETFADLTVKELAKHVDIPNNGVKQAGFYVLVGASMPNVLIETAFLSNREDEKLLRSETGQEQFATAIFSAIKKYKTEYERLLSEGNDVGVRMR